MMAPEGELKGLSPSSAPPRAVIRGVELQNFMSYEHAFIPLHTGLNLICGPNGAGKSTILVAISLLLGQAHTERSRRFSDLVRWGQKEARISLTLDNNLGDGRRLFPHRKEGRVTLTRVLKRSGDYFYLVQNQAISKGEVMDAFKNLGIHPDNMLIIMHQLMVHRFASVSPQEKLRMFEEAVGLQAYREEVLEAFQRLRKASEEEKVLSTILQTTQQSYEFWLREYEKYQRKKALEERWRELEAELAWAKVSSREVAVTRLKRATAEAQEQLARLEGEREENRKRLEVVEALWSALKKERSQLEEECLGMARGEATLSCDLKWTDELLPRVPEEVARELKARRRESEKDLLETRGKLDQIQRRLGEVDASLEQGLRGVVDGRVQAEVLLFRIKLLGEEIARLENQLRFDLEDLEALQAEAHRLGPRVPPRKVADIHAEMTNIKTELGPLAYLSEEVEKVYTSYLKSFEGLRSRAEALGASRKALGEELKRRTHKWSEVMEALLEEVNTDFHAQLHEADATGFARIVNLESIENSGLEILVGFRGQEPVALESLAQSGGERSVALTAFLIALQGRIASPFRAIDEFDVHLDPHNRELVSNIIISNASSMKGVQYVAITPGPVNPPQGVNVIVVQNVGGTSKVGQWR